MATRARSAGLHALVAAGLVALPGCAPTLDWRDIRAQDSGGAQALFPCRPVLQHRELQLGGAPVVLALLSCEAGGQTWALAHADVADPARVGPALAALKAAAAGNIGSAPGAPQPARVAGATPHPASARVRLQGSDPGGRPLQMEFVVFTRGTRVYQATVLGSLVGPETAEVFLSSLRFQP